METIERSDRIQPRLLEDEMRESFIDYSMSVIVQRALPDVRDGLKPVHRRILYAMQEAGLLPNRPYKKSATVVGDVLGKYHPHGDAAVYDSLVRMVQDFSMRYPLVDGQGNFGSIDGDSAAAYRYTEARLAPVAMEMLADIDKETVDLAPNFDDRLREPTVLPARLPNLLVNGSSGIAVGMATNIPPHNLREVVAACRRLIDEPGATVDDLLEHVRAPDFPTGGIVYGEGIEEAYRTGRGRLVMRARTHIEERERGSERIVVTEIPFMVNKARLVEQIAQQVRDRRIEDIADLRDESDRDGIRIVIELKRDAVPHIVLNLLYRHTQMQSTFGVIMLALVGGVPLVMDLPTLLRHFLDHRHEVVVRRSEYDLRVAREREHVLEGLKIAVDHIDEVIEIIRKAKDVEQAGERLRKRFELSERQAKAILDMRLARLTGLEVEKLEEELTAVRAEVKRLGEILASRELRMRIIRDELDELAEKYGDDRRTEILDESPESFSAEDLIAEEPMVITVSHTGYVKRIAPNVYRQQRRGGRGVAGMDTKEEDWVEHLFLASTHDYLLVFTARGKCYRIKVYEIPAGGRTARGKPIVNLLNIGADEQVASIVPVREFSDDRYLVFATRGGTVKKTSLAAYSNVRSSGIHAIGIVDDDRLIDVRLTDGTNDIILATRKGLCIRFHESDVREMGRTARGVRGIRLGRGDRVVGMVVVHDDESTLLTATGRGLGKRSAVEEYRVQRRGGKGLINLKVTERTGEVVAVKEVRDADELMLVTRQGVINRQPVSEIRVIGRNTQGVRLVTLDEGDELGDIALVARESEEGAVETRVVSGARADGGAEG